MMATLAFNELNLMSEITDLQNMLVMNYVV